MLVPFAHLNEESAGGENDQHEDDDACYYAAYGTAGKAMGSTRGVILRARGRR